MPLHILRNGLSEIAAVWVIWHVCWSNYPLLDCKLGLELSRPTLEFPFQTGEKVGDQLETNLHSSPSLHIDTGGWVVRSQSIQGRGRDCRLIALMFHQMEAKEQDRLSKFLTQ